MTERFCSITDLGLDSAGDIYLANVPGETYWFSTFIRKIDRDGRALWETEGGYNAWEQIVVDGNGHVLATGEDNATKISPEGVVLWSVDVLRGWTGVDIAVGASGAVSIAGRRNANWDHDDPLYAPDARSLIVQLSAEGALGWWHAFEEPEDYRFVRVTSGEDVVVAGDVQDPDFPSRVLVRRYDADGDPAWEVSIDASDSHQPLVDLEIGPADEILLAYADEAVVDSREQQSSAVTKLDADGNLVWTYRHRPAGDRDSTPAAIAVAEDGGVALVAGTGGSYDGFWTVRLDPEGELLWEAHYVSPESCHVSDKGDDEDDDLPCGCGG